MRMPSLFLSCVMCVCHNMSILLEILWLSDCPSESCCFELGSKVREFGCHIPTRMSLSLSTPKEAWILGSGRDRMLMPKRQLY